MKKGKRGKISLEEIKENLTNFFLRREEVLLAYLFGSSVGEKRGEKTDIDIAIFIDPGLFNLLDKTQPFGYEAEMISE
jgi:predicted nucleotidyltransferase